MNERICVNTRKAMKDAIDDKYKTIIVTGEIVDDVKREVNNSKKGVINKLSNVSLIGGIFLWPLLIAGLAGKVLSKDDFKKYNVEIDGDSIVLTRKK
ncbi:hypothetical protein [Clostridium perfringens]|uniref:hypothetical protein n=1 Tax=Clostridium perfringens TaxID=1502 RepID=UPI00112B76C6|nr:hypothetical protein [Clostridium perfringens]EGS9999429.1 hypothetical protein [Clostridium perfringens]MBO3328831.1 hypothetical protein [Clostridium perfringens]MDM0464167.1 hypothetical protein [Clostridium perfringens]MDM0469909.1 hypothetical protein [Clostridium perfringens]TPG03491.1 hypothetical protein XA71_01350 [Clostridium perfringens A]